MTATASKFTIVGRTVRLFMTRVEVSSGINSMMVIPALAVMEFCVGGKVFTEGYLVSCVSLR